MSDTKSYSQNTQLHGDSGFDGHHDQGGDSEGESQSIRNTLLCDDDLLPPFTPSEFDDSLEPPCDISYADEDDAPTGMKKPSFLLHDNKYKSKVIRRKIHFNNNKYRK